MIALEHAFPSDFEQAQAAGKPAPPGPGQAKSRDIVPDIGYKIYDIGTFIDTISVPCADIGILCCYADIGVYPISDIPISGIPISVYSDIVSDIGFPDIGCFPISGIPISGFTRYRFSRYRYILILYPISVFPISGVSRYRVYPISGKRRYRVYPISGIIEISADIGVNIRIYRYRRIYADIGVWQESRWYQEP